MSAPYRSPTDLDAMIPRPRSIPPPEPEWPPLVPIEREVSPKPEPRSEARYQTVGLEAFLNEPEPDAPMLVEALGLPAVGTNILGGPPKSLKTLLMTQLGLCVSTVDDEGDCPPFLGYPIARGGPVLFVEEEGGRDPLRRRLNKQRAGLGASATIDFLLFAGIRLDEESSYRRLLATAKHLDPALVVLDPFSFLHGADENKPASMAPIMRRLSRLAGDAETCVVVIHHVTKPQADRPAGRLGDRIRGASSITAGADGFYLLDRKGGDRAQLRGEFRDHEPIDVTVELDPDTLLLHRVDAQRADGKIDPDELIAFVDERSRTTARDVMSRFGVVKATALAALEAHPELDRSDGGPRGQFVYFRTVQ